MKYFQLIALLIFISSCSSTKNIGNKSSETKVKPQNQIDTSLEESTKIEDTIQNSETEEIIEQSNIEHDSILVYPEAFNHNSWNILLKRYVSENGNVNYKGFNNDRKSLLNYIRELGEITPNEDWKKTDKLTYWINAYNALTIDLILRHYPIKSIKDIKDPWDQRYWKLGDKWYNLNEIEHKILRKMNEPRIHFAIVCASISCPKLQNTAFNAENLDNQLTNVTKEFLNDTTRNELSENDIQLSKLFQWFAKDFKQDGSLIDFLNRYASVEISSKAKKSFKNYNWDLNE